MHAAVSNNAVPGAAGMCSSYAGELSCKKTYVLDDLDQYVNDTLTRSSVNVLGVQYCSLRCSLLPLKQLPIRRLRGMACCCYCKEADSMFRAWCAHTVSAVDYAQAQWGALGEALVRGTTVGVQGEGSTGWIRPGSIGWLWHHDMWLHKNMLGQPSSFHFSS
jgi:hypothetical protein